MQVYFEGPVLELDIFSLLRSKNPMMSQLGPTSRCFLLTDSFDNSSLMVILERGRQR